MAELGVAIGTRASGVSADKAHDGIAEYVALNDVSARDLQFSDGQWVRGKSLDTFCPMGPSILTRDVVLNANSPYIRCWLKDQVLSDSSTAEMIFQYTAKLIRPLTRRSIDPQITWFPVYSVSELTEFATHSIALFPGDVIATGTPHGVGVFRDPEIFMKDGNVVTVEIETLGQL